MTPSDYKKLIIQTVFDNTKETTYDLSDDDFNSFCDTARTFGSGKLVLDQWEKFLKTGNTDVKDFIEWCIDIWIEREEDI